MNFLAVILKHDAHAKSIQLEEVLTQVTGCSHMEKEVAVIVLSIILAISVDLLGGTKKHRFDLDSLLLPGADIPEDIATTFNLKGPKDFLRLEYSRESAEHTESEEVTEKIRGSITRVQNRILFRFWIYRIGLFHRIFEIEKAGVLSLDDAFWFTEELAAPLLGEDVRIWRRALATLPATSKGLDDMKTDLWSEIFQAAGVKSWRYLRIVGGIMLVTVTSTVVFGGLLLLVPDTWFRRRSNERRGAPGWQSELPLIVTSDICRALTRFFRAGKSLAESAKISFDWTEPQTVGQTMKFTVKLFKKGKPYPVSDSDDVYVQIMHNGRNIEAAVEIGGVKPELVNNVLVSFTVKKAGEYRIQVKIGNEAIPGSPFSKTFLPGPPDIDKTAVVQQMSTIVAVVSRFSQIAIEPKDRFENSCRISDLDLTDFHIKVFKDSGGVEEETIMEPQPVEILRSVIFRIMLLSPGVYKAKLTFRGTVLKGGEFNIVVLTVPELETVSKFVAGNTPSIEFESRLTRIGDQKCLKPKKVYACVSPKQFILREYFLGFIGKRVATFRVCPVTRFSFLGKDENLGLPSVAVGDGTQPSVTFASKDVNVIAATFTEHLMKNIGGSETFLDKQNFFYSEMRRHHSNKPLDKVLIFIDRAHLLSSSMLSTKGLSSQDWCRNFEVRFVNEEGIDWGGLRREWFNLLCSELFDPKSQLFVPFSNNPQALVHPNPHRPTSAKLKYYEFAGKIVGKCLYESSLGPSMRQLVRARFTRSFLAQLIGLRINYGFFEYDDPDLYVTKVKYILSSSVSDLDMTFTEEEFDPNGKLIKVVDLIPGGSSIRVTNSNKVEYLNALAQYRLVTKVRTEVEAFLKGLRCLVPEELLMIFDEKEIELLLCGVSEFSVEDFKRNCIVNGSSSEFRRVVRWFWTIVSNFTHEEMARLLQFTTGCSQLPPGGFGELMPRFQVAELMSYNTLPVAHTCFNQLCLPDYESFERMEKCLLIAIKEGSEGFQLA